MTDNEIHALVGAHGFMEKHPRMKLKRLYSEYRKADIKHKLTEYAFGVVFGSFKGTLVK